MANDRTTLPSEYSPRSVTSLLGDHKTITAATAFRCGSVAGVELQFSDSTIGFIKVGSGNRLEIGGSVAFDTGTQVSW